MQKGIRAAGDTETLPKVIVPRPDLSKKRQCELLGVNRSSLYYKPVDLKVMRLMDEEFLEHPTKGVLGMVDFIKTFGILIGPKRVRRLLRKMRIMAIYPRRNLSKRGATKYVCPYELRVLEITHSNHVWCIDITYVPMEHGFMYLTAIIDVYSRYIVGRDISNTLDAENSLKVLQRAIAEYGKPEIINSDQGSQFTCAGWTEYLKEQGITISMDGRGRCLDNIYIERFWRTVNQEYIYLNPAEDGKMLRQGMKEFIAYYNNKRTHQSLGRMTPESWNEYTA